jgi:antitoxin MazE
MHVQVQKWGNSLAFRIPRAFVRETDISQGTTVDLGIKNGNLIVTPLRKKISLKNILTQVNQSNIHHEVDFGPNQGLENW